MHESTHKVHDALDAVITHVFAEKVFNTELELNDEKRNELRFSILTKLNEMGVKLIDIQEDELTADDLPL